MQLNELKKLVASIKECLASQSADGKTDLLARDYFQKCEEVSHRLDQCVSMIEKGSDYQALQLAESAPALMDVLTILEFAERGEWIKHCRSSRIPHPLEFDASKVQLLGNLYQQGISANHPLYKDYRGAVSQRNDAKAIQIIKTITKLNPSDENARIELNRLEGKRFYEGGQQMRSAHQSGDDEKIVTILTELEMLDDQKRLEGLPELAIAMEARRRLNKQRAVCYVQEALPGLIAEKEAGNWQTVGVTLARIDQMCLENNLTIPSELHDTTKELRKYYSSAYSADSERSAFENSVELTMATAQDISNQARRRSQMSLSEAQGKLSVIQQQWDAVQRFGRNVPEEVALLIRSSATALRSDVERMQRQRKLKITALTAVVVMALFAGGWAAYTHHKAKTLGEKLKASMAATQVRATDAQLNEIETHHTRAKSWSNLSETMALAQNWVKQEDAKGTAAEQALSHLEALARNNFEDLDSAQIENLLNAVRQKVAALAIDLAPPAKFRLDELENTVDAKLVAIKTDSGQKALTLINELKTLVSRLDFKTPRHQLASEISEIDSRVISIEQMIQGGGSERQKLSSDITAKLASIQNDSAVYAEQLKKFKLAEATARTATTIGEYKAALKEFEGVKFLEAAAARTILSTLPEDTDKVLAGILLENPAQWGLAKASGGTLVFRPKAVFDQDFEILVKLREDPCLNNLYFSTGWDGKVERTVYSSGVPTATRFDQSAPPSPTAWKGGFWDASQYPGGVNFEQSEVGVSKRFDRAMFKETAISKLMRNLKLQYMTDSSGKYYEQDLLPIFEKLASDQSAPVEAKTYVWGQLQFILNRDPVAWGGVFAPTLLDDSRKLSELGKPIKALLSDTWMLGRTEASTKRPLVDFFKSLEGRSYKEEAESYSNAFSKVVKMGCTFAGFLDANGIPNVIQSAVSAQELWIFDSQNIPQPIKPPFSGVVKLMEKPFMFAPLFWLPMDRQEIKAQSKPRWPKVPYFNVP